MRFGRKKNVLIIFLLISFICHYFDQGRRSCPGASCSPINVLLYLNVEEENFDSKISSTFIHIRLYVIVITNSRGRNCCGAELSLLIQLLNWHRPFLHNGVWSILFVAPCIIDKNAH